MSDLIEAHLAHLSAGGYSSDTLDDRGKILRRLERELPFGIEQVGTEDLEGWLARYGGWTLYTYRNHITEFYRWAAIEHLDFDPALAIVRGRPPKCVPRPATDEQVVAAVAAPPPWCTAAKLAAYNGLRCGEVARLSRDLVGEQHLIVRRKGGRLASLPTHPLVWEEVRDLPDGPLVPNSRGRHFQPDDLSTAASRKLGVRLHRLRHWFATKALLPEDEGGAGMNLRQVQELLGHSSPTSTAIYTEVTDGQLRRAIQKLPPAPRTT